METEKLIHYPLYFLSSVCHGGRPLLVPHIVGIRLPRVKDRHVQKRTYFSCRADWPINRIADCVRPISCDVSCSGADGRVMDEGL